MIGIYKITSPNGKVYIGQTIDHERRFRHYKNLSCKEQPRLYRSLVKYGVESHKFEMIWECDKEKLTKWERYFQDTHKSTGKNGLNCILVKTDEFSGGHSEESKKKISDSLKGRIFNEEHKSKIGEANKKRIYSEETKRKISESKKGKRLPQEIIDKATKSRIGLKRNQETKDKMSRSAKLKCTKEWRENLSNKLKGRVITPEWREKLRIAALNRKNKDN